MKRIVFAFLVAGAGMFPAVQAEAADIRFLSNAAFHSLMDDILPAWEKSTGNKVIVVPDTPSKGEQRIAAGETYDIVLTNADSGGRLEKSGAFVAFKPIARAGISVGVRNGTPKPDISTGAAFKATMLAAKSASTTEPGPFGSSGWVVMKAFETLGITEAMKPKMVFVRPPVTASVPLAAGEVEIAIQQTSELINKPGVTVVGPLPPEVQYHTTYLVGLSPNAGAPAKELQALMLGPQTRALLEQKGLIAP